jgi:ABC-type thiamine transport system ATPase subunit
MVAPPEPVLDAATFLAYRQDEPGGEITEGASARARAHRRADRVGAAQQVAGAVAIAARPSTRPQGLSLGDRVCLATALRLSRPVLTADRLWATLDVDVSVHLIRR